MSLEPSLRPQRGSQVSRLTFLRSRAINEFSKFRIYNSIREKVCFLLMLLYLPLSLSGSLFLWKLWLISILWIAHLDLVDFWNGSRSVNKTFSKLLESHLNIKLTINSIRMRLTPHTIHIKVFFLLIFQYTKLLRNQDYAKYFRKFWIVLTFSKFNVKVPWISDSRIFSLLLA